MEGRVSQRDVKLTDTTKYERNEVEGSLAASLKDMKRGCNQEQSSKHDSCCDRWVISKENEIPRAG